MASNSPNKASKRPYPEEGHPQNSSQGQDPLHKEQPHGHKLREEEPREEELREELPQGQGPEQGQELPEEPSEERGFGIYKRLNAPFKKAFHKRNWEMMSDAAKQPFITLAQDFARQILKVQALWGKHHIKPENFCMDPADLFVKCDSGNFDRQVRHNFERLSVCERSSCIRLEEQWLDLERRLMADENNVTN